MTEKNRKPTDKSGRNIKHVLSVDFGIERLLSLLARYGGKIITSNELDAEAIAQARENNRMCVDENNIEYIWEPPDSFERYYHMFSDKEPVIKNIEPNV